MDFARWQDGVLSDLDRLEKPPADRKFVADCLSGRLTGIDRLVEQIPEAKDIVIRRAHELNILPEPVVHALSTYPDRPAGWLTDREPTLPAAADLNLLSDAVTTAVTDGHREAVLKCLQIWASVQAGTFRSDNEMIELLKPYPIDEATRSRADTVVRAAWGASKGAQIVSEPTFFDAAIQWAKTFWDFNLGIRQS